MENFEEILRKDLHQFLLTIVDVDALLHGLADEIASVKGVPRIRTINHWP